jgi:hypothetical protein
MEHTLDCYEEKEVCMGERRVSLAWHDEKEVMQPYLDRNRYPKFEART